MKVQILDHRVMQLIFRPSKALLDFVASDITDDKEKLPIACKIVSAEEKDDQEFLFILRLKLVNRSMLKELQMMVYSMWIFSSDVRVAHL